MDAQGHWSFTWHSLTEASSINAEKRFLWCSGTNVPVPQCTPKQVYVWHSVYRTGGSNNLTSLWFWVLPFRNHGRVWHFNFWCISPVRQNLNKQFNNPNLEIPLYVFLNNSFIYYQVKYVFKSNKCNIWYRSLCFKLQRSNGSCRSSPSLHTLQQGFWPTLPTVSLGLSYFGVVALYVIWSWRKAFTLSWSWGLYKLTDPKGL